VSTAAQTNQGQGWKKGTSRMKNTPIRVIEALASSAGR